MNRWLPALALIGLFVAFQFAGLFIKGWPLNFQPLLAVAFCCMACLGGRQWWIITAAWLIAWPILSAHQGYKMDTAFLATVCGFASVFFIGRFFRKTNAPLAILGGVTLSALSFFLITNTFAFFSLTHLYPRNLTGFIQAQWTGPSDPAFGPTWVFLRNSIGGSLLFTGLFLIAQQLSPASEEETEAEPEEDSEPSEA